jgi:hypothetical protein
MGSASTSWIKKGSARQPDAKRRPVEAKASGVQAILSGSSYQLAEKDMDFFARNDLRGVRLLLEYLKPELLIAEHGIRHYRSLKRHAHL